MTAGKEEDWLDRLDRRILDWLWDQKRPTTGPAGWGVMALRVAYMSARNSLSDRVPFQASALTFMTLLGLVPALAISFSVAKGLGFAGTLKKMLLENEFVASQTEVFTKIIGYVENTQVGTLGAVGLVLLVGTLVITLSSVEATFNRIWNVRVTRSWTRRFTDYLSVLIIVPLLILMATGAWATVSGHSAVRELLNMAVVGRLAGWGLSLGPLLLLSTALTFFYMFLPNTNIPFKSAALAGVLAGAMWWGVQSSYIYFQIGVARYNAIYGGFASLPLFFIWLQVSWTVVLLGAELAHAHHVCRRGPLPRYLLPPMSPAQREALALRILYRLALRFENGQPAMSLAQLARELNAPERELHYLVSDMIDVGLVVDVGEEGRIQPGRSLDSITLADALALLRGEGASVVDGADDREVCRLLSQAELAGRQVLGEFTLQELVKRSSPGGPETGGEASCPSTA